MHRAPLPLWLLASLLFVRLGEAQPDDSASAAAPGPSPAEEVRLPEVSDPMLEPVPPPSRVLRSWREALTLVRDQNTALRLGTARVRIASGQARQALAPTLPTLTGTANVTRHLLTGTATTGAFGLPDPGVGASLGRIPDPLATWNAGLGARVPLLATKAWHDARTARLGVSVAEAERLDSTRLVLGATADAIVTVVTAERLAEVTRVSLRSALSTLQLNRRRAALGAASAVDVLRAEQEVAASRAQVVSASESLQVARESLGALLGSVEPYGVVPAIRLDELAVDARSSCRPETRLDSRPDVVRARRNVEVARRNVAGSRWDHVPTVDGISNLTYYSDERRTANLEHVTWTIGAVLTWQLYDGGLRYGRRRTHQGELALAEESLRQLEREASVEISQARRGVQVAEANLAVSRQVRDLAREGARLARLAFVNGTGTSFDLVDTAERLRAAEIDLAVKEFEGVRAQIAALLALATCEL